MKQRLFWIISAVMMAVLAFNLPGSMAQRDDDYSFVRTLVDIHRLVATNYVDPVNEDKLRQGAIDGMLGQLDPFSIYIPPVHQEEFDNLLEGSFKGVGIQLDQTPDHHTVVVTPIDDSPAFHAGIMAGDIIEKVNGESIDNLRLDEVIKKISGPIGSKVTLTVKHVTGKEQTVTMTRQEVNVPEVVGYERNPDNSWNYWVSDHPKVAYMQIKQFTPNVSDKVHQTLQSLSSQGMEGLILDLRFNPGGLLEEAAKIINSFIPPDKVIVSTKGRNRPEHIEYSDDKDKLPQFPLIVLINEHSASASEIVSGSLLDNKRALVIGQRSYGKGSVQEVMPLEDKSGELKLTVAYYYLPSGRLVHRKPGATDWGVDPQIVVPVDAQGEEAILNEMYERELFHRPTTTPSKPTTTVATTTTQPTDPQLQQAITTMVGLIVLQNEKSNTTARVEHPVAQSVHELTTAPTTQSQ
ncbi:MAG TPA: S41 family peptidase [Tepidisphaeraceae bacterium]